MLTRQESVRRWLPKVIQGVNWPCVKWRAKPRSTGGVPPIGATGVRVELPGTIVTLTISCGSPVTVGSRGLRSGCLSNHHWKSGLAWSMTSQAMVALAEVACVPCKFTVKTRPAKCSWGVPGMAGCVLTGRAFGSPPDRCDEIGLFQDRVHEIRRRKTQVCLDCLPPARSYSSPLPQGEGEAQLWLRTVGAPGRDGRRGDHSPSPKGRRLEKREPSQILPCLGSRKHCPAMKHGRVCGWLNSR